MRDVTAAANETPTYETPLELVLSRFKDSKPDGDGCVVFCPAHADKKTASLKIDETPAGVVLLKCRAGCDTSDVLAKIGLKMSELFPRNTLTIEMYSEAKGLPVEFLKRLGVGTYGGGAGSKGGPKLRIPYHDVNGQVKSVRFRLSLDKSGDGTKFKWKTGDKLMPYGLDRLADARKQGYVVLPEGESDTQTLWLHGIPALGIPGASTWNEKWSEYLDGIDVVYVTVEPDAGGANIVKRFERSKIKDRLRFITFENESVKDPSALYLKDRKRFPVVFAKLMKSADTWDEHAAELVAIARRESALKCKQIVESGDVLSDFMVELDKAGVVGEARAAKILYLAFTTRVFAKIVPVVIQSTPSSGKSFLLNTVKEFFPPESYYSVTAMSEKALVYLREPLSHRFLVLQEADGVSKHDESQQQYFIRTLLSEGLLRYEVTDKETRATVTVEVPGPIGLAMTTANYKIEDQLQTRVITVRVTESQEQTEAVMRRIAEQRPDTSDKETWRAFQTWIASGPTEVVVPYAEVVAAMIPGVATRLRRDFTTILGLIKAHALLHQENRATAKQGRVVADLTDYEAVHGLMCDLIAEQVGRSVDPRVRQVHEAIARLTEKHAESERGGDDFPGATNSEVAVEMNMTKQGIKLWVDKASGDEWIKNVSKNPRERRWVIDKPMPEAVAVLPSPEDLRAELDRRDAEKIKSLTETVPAKNSNVGDDRGRSKAGKGGAR